MRTNNGFKCVEWTNVIAKGLKTIHPYCSFAFRRHRLKTLGSKRQGPHFRCLAYCRFQDCSVTATITVEDLKATVKFDGQQGKHSCTELRTRPVRGSNRHRLGLQLQSQLPRAMYLENLGKLEHDVVMSGCRDEAPSPQILKTIGFEARQKTRLHSNDLISLQLMSEGKKKNPDNVLQKVLQDPKGVMLWSQRSIDILYIRSAVGKTSFIWMPPDQ